MKDGEKEKLQRKGTKSKLSKFKKRIKKRRGQQTMERRNEMGEKKKKNKTARTVSVDDAEKLRNHTNPTAELEVFNTNVIMLSNESEMKHVNKNMSVHLTI